MTAVRLELASHEVEGCEQIHVVQYDLPPAIDMYRVSQLFLGYHTSNPCASAWRKNETAFWRSVTTLVSAPSAARE